MRIRAGPTANCLHPHLLGDGGAESSAPKLGLGKESREWIKGWEERAFVCPTLLFKPALI